MRRTRALALTLTATLALTAGACSDDDGRDDGGAAASSSTTVTDGEDGDDDGDPEADGSTTSSVAGPDGAEDWDGTRFDIGIVDRIDRLEDGRTIVVFDRVQLETEEGRKEAKAFEEEPIVYGNTDHPFVNDNTRLRRFVASPDMEVLLLGNRRDVCPDEEIAEPRWDRSSVDAVVDGSLWDDYQQVSLTFDTGTGHVTRIRFSSGC